MPGRAIRSGGHGFVGIGRKRLLNILQARCESLGVRLAFDREVRSDTEFPDAEDPSPTLFPGWPGTGAEVSGPGEVERNVARLQGGGLGPELAIGATCCPAR